MCSPPLAENKIKIDILCKGFEDNNFIYELQFNYKNLSEILKCLADGYKLENCRFI